MARLVVISSMAKSRVVPKHPEPPPAEKACGESDHTAFLFIICTVLSKPVQLHREILMKPAFFSSPAFSFRILLNLLRTQKLAGKGTQHDRSRPLPPPTLFFSANISPVNLFLGRWLPVWFRDIIHALNHQLHEAWRQ